MKHWMEFKEEQTPEEIAETCEITASLLEGNWTQGAWLSAGRMCVEGALSAAFGFNADLEVDATLRRNLQDCNVYKAIIDTINEAMPDDDYGSVSYSDMAGWNDAGSRTEQEVLDILHKTAKRVMGVEP